MSFIPSILVHGGASPIRIPEQHKKIVETILANFAQDGLQNLLEGKSSTEVVLEIIKNMEESGVFNAGRGAVPQMDKVVRRDAAIMSGKDLSIGSVIGIENVQTPILTAYTVMKSPYVTLQGLKNEISLSTNNSSKNFPTDTIGCIAVDMWGNISTATSTGGIGSTFPGRVGDAGIVGSGFYTNNQIGVLCSGIGEYFMRTCLAKYACDLNELLDLDVHYIASKSIDYLTEKTHVSDVGAIFILDKNGNYACEKNCKDAVFSFLSPMV
jgi:beta-aspartyl-peptidase (threonine type)